MTIIKKTISGVEYGFIVDTDMTYNNSGVNVYLSIDKNKDIFSKLSNQSEIYEAIATEVAKSINAEAFLMFNNIDNGTEWQGQFHFY